MVRNVSAGDKRLYPRMAYVPFGVGVRWGLVCPAGARARGPRTAWGGFLYVPMYISLYLY